MKQIYGIGIISFTLGAILLIPSFLSEPLETLRLLLMMVGLSFILIALLLLFYNPKQNNNN